jgi:hypothetical protein
VLAVEGTVEKIDKLMERPYVALKTEKVMGSIQCFFDKDSTGAITPLSKGDRVKIAGRCKGKSLVNVRLQELRLVAPAPNKSITPSSTAPSQ